MAWRIAKTLETLKAQVNALAPKRNKASDGGIGDAGHASRASDHNPWVKDGSMGVVTAYDFTHDPGNGVDDRAIVLALVASLDPRIKYIIWDRRICNSQATAQTPAWTWRSYYGKNPHNKHFHISVRSEKSFYDFTKDWVISGVIVTPVSEVPVVLPKKATMAVGTITEIQTLLKDQGYDLGPKGIDGKNGPATQKAVKAFQKAHPPLRVDGKVGDATWIVLKGPVEPPVPVPVPLGDRVGKAMSEFTATWGKKERAAGLVGNFQQESYKDLRPDVMGDKIDGDFSAFGFSQHRKERFLALVRFALDRGKAWTNFDTQIAFVNKELLTTEKYAGDLLRRADTIEEATAAGIFYLRPAGVVRPETTDWPAIIAAAKKGHGWNNRVTNAKSLL